MCRHILHIYIYIHIFLIHYLCSVSLSLSLCVCIHIIYIYKFVCYASMVVSADVQTHIHKYSTWKHTWNVFMTPGKIICQYVIYVYLFVIIYVYFFFPKASLMLGFSFSCSNRVGAIRKRRICGRYCYVTMLCVELSGCSCGGEGDGDEVTVLFAAVGGRCWGARLRRRICGRCCWG